MRLTIIPADKFCAVDGYGIHGVDMEGIDPDVHAVQFSGSSGHVEYTDKKPNAPIKNVARYQAIIDRHATMRAEIEAKAADPFYGMAPSEAVALAVARKTAEIKQYAIVLQQRQITWDGVLWDADEEAVKAIQGVFLECFFYQDTDPVPTPEPFPGYWKSGQLNSNGNPVMIPMTVGKFKQFYRALYASVSQVWGRREIQCATIEALPAEGLSAQQIMAYDITQGWGG